MKILVGNVRDKEQLVYLVTAMEGLCRSKAGARGMHDLPLSHIVWQLWQE
jgi:hypothetical protein